MNKELDNSKYFKNLDWRKLKTFYYVAKEKNLSNAAKILNMTIAPLSRQISTLENHLGYPLFSRTTTGVTLTRRGEELFEIVEHVFLEIKEFSNNSYLLKNQGQKQKIRIATTQPVAAYILNDYLIAYNKQHPDLAFELIGNDRVIDLLVNDVDIVIKPYEPQNRLIQQEHLLTLEKKLFASTEYLQKHGYPQQIEDLRNHYIVAQSNPIDHPYSDIHWILKLGAKQGDLHRPVFTSSSLECLVEAVKAGFGIISCYEEMTIIKNAHLEEVLREINRPRIDWNILYPRYLHYNTSLMKFVDFLMESFKPLRRGSRQKI